MKTITPLFRLVKSVTLTLAAILGAASVANASAPVVSVYSRTSNGYTRTRLADNTFKAEAYCFAPAGRLNGPMIDKSIDDLSFYQVAAVVTQALRTEQYIPAADPKKTDLLIFLSWGTTTGVDRDEYNRGLSTLADAWSAGSNFVQFPGPGDASGLDTNAAMREAAQSQLDGAYDRIAMTNRERDMRNYRNAAILGYSSALDDAQFLKPYAPSSRDVIGDVEENRYFVVLQAYDFQRLWKRHEKVLLWETRYSVRQFGNRFDRELPVMAKYAAQFCGQNVPLIRRPLPKGNVMIGTPVIIETNSPK